eukprot:4814675-Alexandrium_andersonii.AAC.1
MPELMCYACVGLGSGAQGVPLAFCERFEHRGLRAWPARGPLCSKASQDARGTPCAPAFHGRCRRRSSCALLAGAWRPKRKECPS